MMDISDISNGSDKTILDTIGAYIKYHRQNQNMTQSELSEAADINRSTLSEIENGNRSNTITLIRLLRSLGKLEVLMGFTKTQKISPLALAEEQAIYRKRVRHKKGEKPNTPKSDW